MEKTGFKQTFINGLFLAIPLLAILYIGLKVVRIIEKLITPLAHKAGVQHILGELTLTIFALLLLLILFFILGILLRIRMMKSLNKQVEGIAYKIMPQLYKLKSLATDGEESNGWKTVLLQEGDSWTPAYIVAKTEKWFTAFLPDAPDGKSGQIKMFKTADTNYKMVEGLKFRNMLHHYGIGMIELENEDGKL